MDNGAGSYRRFLDGDESAFDEIIKEYLAGLIFFIDRYVHDTATAEDIAIDAFSDLVVHRHRYNFKVTLKTYLFMIGRSRALNYIKHRNKINFVPLSDMESDVCCDDRKSMEERILSEERKRTVNNAITQLPENMQTAVHLVYFENMSYEEVAKVMRKNRKQIDNLLYRAKAMLRTILREEGEALL